jgi:hypothetical protein
MIQPTSNLIGFNRADAVSNATTKPASTPPPSAETGERLLSSNSQALRQALNQTPEIRPEVVDKGRHLAVDPNYPPRELILRLAEMMTKSVDLSDQA